MEKYYSHLLWKMRKRTVKKNFWLSHTEDHQLKDLSSLLNLSEADTIRKLLYETYVKAPPPIEFYDAIDKINKIGVNINQLTKIANSTNKIFVYDLNRQFKELNDLIKDIREKFL